MSDRFKFRAWHKKHKEMVYFSNEKLIHDHFQSRCFAELLSGKYGDVLMQCTGLRDKNGKLIWEGDIVSLDDIKIEVTWFDGGFHILTNKDQTRSPLIQQRARYFEVIGNKFQNEDLLNDC